MLRNRVCLSYSLFSFYDVQESGSKWRCTIFTEMWWRHLWYVVISGCWVGMTYPPLKWKLILSQGACNVCKWPPSPEDCRIEPSVPSYQVASGKYPCTEVDPLKGRRRRTWWWWWWWWWWWRWRMTMTMTMIIFVHRCRWRTKPCSHYTYSIIIKRSIIEVALLILITPRFNIGSMSQK